MSYLQPEMFSLRQKYQSITKLFFKLCVQDEQFQV